jgi:hypothetical protein
MEIHNLMAHQDTIKKHLVFKINSDACLLRQLADDMAESATAIHGQGYSAFVNSRERFLSELTRVSDEYCMLVSPDNEFKKP